MSAFLSVRNLDVSYRGDDHREQLALDDVDFDIYAGEILGVLGESGSGKSTLANSLVRLLPPNGVINSGSIFLNGRDVMKATPNELRQIRGRCISLISQEPSLALHPVMRIRDQVSEVLRAHESLTRKERLARIRQTLQAVLTDDAERIASSYPHQLSGGQKQRAMIAQAIICRPPLLIADEPTGSLDPTSQMATISLFRSLRSHFGLSILLISHDPRLLAEVADRILVLYAGRVMEIGSAQRMLIAPRHPYTRALLRSMVPHGAQALKTSKTHLEVIAGQSQRASRWTMGCSFASRCTELEKRCWTQRPRLAQLANSEAVACMRFRDDSR